MLTPPFKQSSPSAIFFCAAILVASPATSQEPVQEPPPAWRTSFDEIEVERVDPDELPGAEESVLPSSLAKSGALPRPTSLEMLRRTAETISDRVVEVVVVPMNRSSVKQSAIVLRGEAVWLSGHADGSAPILVTNAHWLAEATAIFVRPATRRAQGELPRAERRSIAQLNPGADVKALLQDPDLVPATVRAVDEHRNLATLVPDETRAKAPSAGLTFFPIDDEAPSAAYGFSHQMGSALVQTHFLAPRERRDEILFYLHTTFPVILGAPIVSDDGRVIALTASRHPTEPERTLVIPPRALRKYVDKVQSNATDSGER